MKNKLTKYYNKILSKNVKVLMFHSVYESSYGLPSIAISKNNFEKLIGLISKYMKFISVDDLINTLDGTCELPTNPIIITFDDAYRNITTNALPFLELKQIPYAVYPIPKYIDIKEQRNIFWWEKYYLMNSNEEPKNFDKKINFLKNNLSNKIDKYINAHNIIINEELKKELSSMGIADIRKIAKSHLAHIGIHTLNHPCLGNLSTLSQEREISLAKTYIQKITKRKASSIAYPSGSYNERTLEIIRKLDINIGFSTIPGKNIFPLCQYILKRINISDETVCYRTNFSKTKTLKRLFIDSC